jgi:hypothetical protein
MIADYFKIQIDFYPPIIEEILEKAEFKSVWSGKRIQVGDKLLHAYVYQPGTDDLKAITFLERELHELDNRFNYIRLERDVVPVLSFKEDTKTRTNGN